MADMQTGDFLRIVVPLLMPDGVEAVNRFELFCSNEGDFTPLLAAGKAWIEAIYTELIAITNQNIQMAPCQFSRIVWSVDKWVIQRIIGTVTPSVTFTNTDPMAPHAVAAVGVFPTVVPKVRGRKFFPGIVESAIDNSSLTAGALAAVGAALLKVITAVNAADGGQYLYSILSQKDGGLAGPSSVEVNTLSGTMRRRKPGVGS